MKQSECLQIDPSERDCHDLGHEKPQRYFLKMYVTALFCSLSENSQVERVSYGDIKFFVYNLFILQAPGSLTATQIYVFIWIQTYSNSNMVWKSYRQTSKKSKRTPTDIETAPKNLHCFLLFKLLALCMTLNSLLKFFRHWHSWGRDQLIFHRRRQFPLSYFSEKLDNAWICTAFCRVFLTAQAASCSFSTKSVGFQKIQEGEEAARST